MTEVAAEFFNSLPGRAPALMRLPVAGTIRLDLVEDRRTEHWYVMVAPGRAEVSRDERPTDAILTMNVPVFDELVTGRTRAIAAVLRNDATFGGDVRLFLALQRFFPAQPGTRDPREVAREKVAARRQEQTG